MRKELRELIPVWTALYALLIIGVVASHLSQWCDSTSPRIQYPFALFGLNCFMLYVFFASTLTFVREVEEKRFDFLRRLPLDIHTVVRGKLTGILVSSVFFAVAAFLTSLIMAAICKTGYQEDIPFLLSRYLVLAAESFCLGLFVSVRSRRIYSALVVGALALLLFDTLVTNAVSEALERLQHISVKARDAITSPWVIGAKLVLLLGFARHMFGGFDWYRFQESPWRMTRLNIGKSNRRLSNEVNLAHKRPGPLAALVWQCWRSSRILILGMSALVLLFLIPLPMVKAPYLLVIWAAFFLYCWILASQAFHTDFNRPEGLMLARTSVPPRYVWLSRVIVFGSFVSVIAMIFLVVTLSCNGREAGLLFWTRAMDMRFTDLLILGGPYLPVLAPRHIAMSLIAIPSVFFGSLLTGAFSSSRILSFALFIVILPLMLTAVWLYEASLREFYFPLMFVYTIVFMILSWYTVRCRLRHREKRSALFWYVIPVPVVLLALFYPQLEWVLLPRESLPFEPDRKVLAIPYNVNEGFDAADFKLEEDLSLVLFHSRWTFTIWDVNSAKRLKDVSLQLEDLEELWTRYCRIYRESDTAFGSFSSQIEMIIVTSIKKNQAQWSAGQRRRAAFFLTRIPRERPDIREQYKRLYQLMYRVTAVTERANDYPFFLSNDDDPRCKPAITRILLGNRLGSLCHAMMEHERFFCQDDRQTSSVRARLLQDRLDKWAYLSARRGFTPPINSECTHPNLAEYPRRALLIAMALTTWYEEHGQWPDNLDELVRAGCLKEIPTVPGWGVPFKMSAKLPQPIKSLVFIDNDNKNRKAGMAHFEYERKTRQSHLAFPFRWDSLIHSRTGTSPHAELVQKKFLVRSSTPVVYDPASYFGLLVPEPSQEPQP